MKKKIFSFKENTINFNVDAQIAGEIIEKIKKQNDGRCTPDDVVKVAQDPDNPLHGVFDWNDVSAANAHRRYVARILIGSLVITYKHHQEVRANFSVKYKAHEEKENRAYVGIEEAVKPDYELQFRQEAFNHLKIFVKRYQFFDYLQKEVKEVQSILDGMETAIAVMSKEKQEEVIV